MHRIVHPWTPPPHVPREILVKLCKELVDEVVKRAIDHVGIVSPSPQSSSRPLGTELPKEEEAQTMKHAHIIAMWQSRCSDTER